MGFLKNILKGEWILNFSTPEEDIEENRSIYLQLNEYDILIKLKPNVERSELLSVLKQIHNEYDEMIDNIPDLLRGLLDITNDQIETLINVFKPIQIVFMEKSKIETDHYKNDDGLWITQIFKNENGNIKEIASISKINKTEFKSLDVNDLD